MYINKIISEISKSNYFKHVDFRKDLDNIDDHIKRGKLQLPACFLLPVQSKGQPPATGNGIRQERITEYHFVLVGYVKDDEEFIEEAIDQIKNRVFGLQVTPQHHPMWFNEGRLHELNSKYFYWQEGYATSSLNKKVIS